MSTRTTYVLLAKLAGVREGAVVSTNPAKQSVYETDAEKGTAVRLEGAGGKVLAAFVIGARGPDFASCYLRLDFSRPANSWREPAKK